MKALVFDMNLPGMAVTRLLGILSSRAYVGPTSTFRYREVPDLPAGGTVLVYGCGTLGLLSIAIPGSLSPTRSSS